MDARVDNGMDKWVNGMDKWVNGWITYGFWVDNCSVKDSVVHAKLAIKMSFKWMKE